MRERGGRGERERERVRERGRGERDRERERENLLACKLLSPYTSWFVLYSALELHGRPHTYIRRYVTLAPVFFKVCPKAHASAVGCPL